MRMFNQILRVLLIAACAFLQFAPAAQAAERYKPYVLAWRGTADFDEKVTQVKRQLEGAGFDVVADFDPYQGKRTHVDRARVIVVTSGALKKAVAGNEMGGFAAAQRVGVTKVGDEIQVAYYNPTYMAYAYRLDTSLSNTAAALEQALGRIEEFGSEKGLTERKLRKYHYTFGMEYFDDPYELAEYNSHAEAVAAVEKNLANNDIGIKQVYRIDIPGKQEVLFGILRNAPTEEDHYYDDAWIASVVDFEELKMTPYFPYEVMVEGNKVIALHMRFRMAVSRPDLSMMGSNSFMNLMPSPSAIEKALRAAVTE